MYVHKYKTLDLKEIILNSYWFNTIKSCKDDECVNIFKSFGFSFIVYDTLLVDEFF